MKIGNFENLILLAWKLSKSILTLQQSNYLLASAVKSLTSFWRSKKKKKPEIKGVPRAINLRSEQCFIEYEQVNLVLDQKCNQIPEAFLMVRRFWI